MSRKRIEESSSKILDSRTKGVVLVAAAKPADPGIDDPGLIAKFIEELTIIP